MKRSAGVPLAVESCHPLLQSLEELPHTLSAKAQQRCQDNEELAPGLNCCAVCASDECALDCETCKRVTYCSEAHRQRDAALHGHVCALLAAIQEAEAEEVTEDDEAALVEAFVQSAEAEGTRLGLGTWAEVVPRKYARLLGGRRVQPRTGTRPQAPGPIVAPTPHEPRLQLYGAAAPGVGALGLVQQHHQLEQPARSGASSGSKRRELINWWERPENSPAASNSQQQVQQQHSGAGSQGRRGGSQGAPASGSKRAAASGGTSKGSKGAQQLQLQQQQEDAQSGGELRLAVELVVASSLLTYPLTLLHCLRTCGTVGSTAAACVGAERPLVVCVLGASDGAELAQPAAWRLLEGACPSGVLLQMVGPEVSEALDGTSQLVSGGVSAVFYKGEYQDIVEAILSPGSSSGEEGEDEGSGLLPELRQAPDVLMGCNMGLTCPDYDWSTTLDAIGRLLEAKRKAGAAGPSTSSSAPAPPARLPWVVASNTSLELSMEEEVLRGTGWSPALTARPNPFGSLEPLQSGTLANDVYRKNSWLAVYEVAPRAAKSKASRGVVGLRKRLGSASQGLKKRLSRLSGGLGKSLGTLVKSMKRVAKRLPVLPELQALSRGPKARGGGGKGQQNRAKGKHGRR